MKEELIKWLEEQILEDEGAMIHARDAGHWDRYHGLEGHRNGLVDVLNHLRFSDVALPSEPPVP
jgi:hypothetical protein